MTTSYPYATSRVRVQEGHLIDRARWNRLYEASLQEGIKMLAEMGYGADAKEDSELEVMIDTELLNTRRFINEITPDKALTDLLLLPTDAHNIKMILKGQIQRVDTEAMLLKGGGVELDVLKAAMENGVYDALPVAFQEVLKKLDNEENPRVISSAIDNAVYTEIFRVLKRHKNSLLMDYFQTKVDFTNILTVLRANQLKWESYQVKPLLIQGGTLSERTLSESIGMTDDQLVRQLAHGPYSVKIRNILEHYLNDKNLSSVEQAFSEQAFRIIHEARDDSFGIGPIANYYLTRQAEASALRVMFAGKRAGIEVPFGALGAVV